MVDALIYPLLLITGFLTAFYIKRGETDRLLSIHAAENARLAAENKELRDRLYLKNGLPNEISDKRREEKKEAERLDPKPKMEVPDIFRARQEAWAKQSRGS